MVDKRMASNLSEKRGAQGMQGGEHPEKSSLLAFLRGQRLEDAERIRLHLAHCSRCQEISAELSHEIRPLGLLNQMSRYQRYPELSPTLILRQAQRNAQKQTLWSQVTVGARFTAPSLNHSRPKKAVVRLMS